MRTLDFIHSFRSVLLNEHSYNVCDVCNVSLDHPYSATVDASSEVIHANVIIEGKEYFSFSVPGDGNCCFNSIGLALNQDLTKSTHYRHIICRHVMQNWEIYKHLAIITHDLPSP